VLAHEDARGVVFDALANDDLATDVEDVEDAVDRAACRAVGELLLATSQPVDGLQGGVFRGADEFKFKNTFEVVRRCGEEGGWWTWVGLDSND
jgi:hypothetical protein